MEDPGSRIISALGAGSGINFVQLADDLSETSFSARREQLEMRNQSLEARISAASLLRNSLTSLASALGDRIRTGDLAPRGSIGQPSVASVSVPSGTSPSGSYSLEVTQLAEQQLLASKAYSEPTDLVGEGTLRVRFGTVSGTSFAEDTSRPALEITVEDTDTLETLAGKISSASGGAIEAYVANGTGGSQLVVKGEEGAINGFTIEGESSASSPSAVAGDLSYLSWIPASDAGELRQTAQDAVFELDTVELRSASNSVTNLPEGFMLELAATNTGAPTTIDFSSDTSAISNVMADFVSALNEITSQLAEVAAAAGGSLGNDPGARELRRDLSRLSTEIVMPNAADGEPQTLGELGLSLSRDGTFEFDSERLQETLANSPEGTAAMFTTGVFGVFATVDRLARENTAIGNPGSLGGSVERYEDQIERNDERLAKIAEQQERLRERLTRDLVAAEQRVASSQSTLSFLQQQIDLFNSDN